MLLLFDIDGTLLVTRGAGIAAMGDAGRSLFGPDFSVDGIEFAGRLDHLIWSDLADRNALDPADEALETRFRASYARSLERRLANDGSSVALPGVAALLEVLAAETEVTLGLLTGNYPETGRHKIERAGLPFEPFLVHAWGCDGRHRRELPPVALDRYHGLAADLGRPRLTSDRVVIIGDTPHDVDCALHNGCRCLGVTTGRSTADELRSAGAHAVQPDLSDTRAVVSWLIDG